MNAAEAMQAIEGGEFAAFVNVANNFKTFMRALTAHPAVKSLQAEMNTPAVVHSVFERALALVGSPVQEGYEHPSDAALAAYLWLLSTKNHEAAGLIAAYVLDGKGCWWSRRVAQIVNEESNVRSDKNVPAAS